MAGHEFHPDSFLAQLDDANREVLEDLGPQRRYSVRSTLFHQGEPSRHVLLLTRGWVKITSTSRGGDEALLALRGPGDILGELSAVDGLPRSGTVEVLIEVTARVIEQERFSAALCRNVGLTTALLKHVAQKLREADRHRLDYVSASSSARLAGLILTLAVKHGVPSSEGIVIQPPLSQRELATAAATSREMAARTLRTLRERDIVRTSRQQIVVTRPEVLRSLCRSVS